MIFVVSVVPKISFAVCSKRAVGPAAWGIKGTIQMSRRMVSGAFWSAFAVMSLTVGPAAGQTTGAGKTAPAKVAQGVQGVKKWTPRRTP